MEFREVMAGDIPAILRIMAEAKALMAACGSSQWDDNYPAREHLEADLASGTGHIAHDGAAILGYAAVDFTGEPAYRRIKGQWLSDGPYVVLHRLALASRARGRGLGFRFLAYAESMARERGIKSFKIDTGRDNAAMRHILLKSGFTLCGMVYYGEAEMMAFEKVLP